MLRRRLCLSGADIGYGQHGYRSSPLLIDMSRGEGEAYALHEFVSQYLAEDRHAVAQENYILSKFT